ncbi:BTAD domain-containing putative transcriptional regulator [Sphaerimonospora sp. CA-214678]|uniref:AfsR/SARP family transcriptional regulator n=1 Tax=Sphaerimonospora sp. CA-214678 TaxID=3240029 RepID=UPI003D91C4EF
MLATLLLHANEFVSVDRLLKTVWGDSVPRSAHATLQTYVMRLRRFLQNQGIGNCPIRTLPGGYRIDASVENLDLLRLRQLIARARRQRSNAVEEARYLDEALALWHGPPLVNIPSEVLHREEVPRLTEQLLEITERRMDLELQAGRYRSAVAELRALTAAHPHRERFWEQLMEALYGSGRQVEALEEYRRIKETLRDELGVDPGPGLQRMELAVLKGEHPPAGRAAAPIALMPTAASTPLTGSCQLPPDAPYLIGRGKLIDTIADNVIRDSDRPGTTITIIRGVPGVGKSAVALRLAYEVSRFFSGGQWYVRLRDSDGAPRQAADVLAELLERAGVDPAQIPQGEIARQSALRAATWGRGVLILVDDVVDAEQVQPLLTGCPDAAFIATSRRRLLELTAWAGVRSFELPPLPSDSSLELLATILGRELISGEEQHAAWRLAELCGHLPLALRIAAAKLADWPGHSLADFVAWLAADPLMRLAVGRRGSISMRRSFAGSYASLSSDGRNLFRLIGVKVKSPEFTLEEVARFTGMARREVEPLLEELLDAGLLGSTAPNSFWMPRLLHQYAGELACEEFTGAAYASADVL